MARGVERLAATVQSGQSLSDTIWMNGTELVGILMPSAWTGDLMSFQVSWDGATWYNLHIGGPGLAEGSEVFLKVAPNQCLGFNERFGCVQACVNYLRIRSGISGSPLVQLGTRNFYVLVADR